MTTLGLPFSLQMFDLMSPLHQLGRARWSMLHGMDKVAEKALDLGLEISEEVCRTVICCVWTKTWLLMLMLL